MFNNSSVLPSLPMASADIFDKQLQCVLGYMLNKTASYDQARQACSMYKDFTKLGPITAIVFWLVGIFIIITNAAVILTIIRTRTLRKPVYFYMANLAMSDLMSGIGHLYYADVEYSLYSRLYSTNVIFYSQVMSATALALFSLNSYVAVRHPIFFRIHSDTAKRDAGIAIASSWLIVSLVVFTPSMGWNCLDMPSPNCSGYYNDSFVGLSITMVLLPAIIMVFTNTSVFIAIKKRQKNRLGQPEGQHNNPTQAEAERKFQKSVEKSRTVLIHVVVAFVFWLISILSIPICKQMCPPSTGPRGVYVLLLMTLNAAINPITSTLRTPELRDGLWQNMTDIHRVLVTVFRGNRVNPQNVQPALQNPASVREISENPQVQQHVLQSTLNVRENPQVEQPALQNTSNVRKIIVRENPQVQHPVLHNTSNVRENNVRENPQVQQLAVQNASNVKKIRVWFIPWCGRSEQNMPDELQIGGQSKRLGVSGTYLKADSSKRKIQNLTIVDID
ncbi:sphingosine 1-phosphate receptor 1-like [Branchiostoma floridae x Branchiostoma japonicum]